MVHFNQESESQTSYLGIKSFFLQGLTWIFLAISFFISLPFGFFCLFLKLFHWGDRITFLSRRRTCNEVTHCKNQEHHLTSSQNDLMEWMLLELKHTQHSLENKTLAAQVEHISMMSGQLFARYLLNTQEKSTSGYLMDFLHFYLSLTFHTTRAYCILERTPNPQTTLSQLEVMMDLLVGAFEQQCDQLHSNSSLDFSQNKQTLQALAHSCSVPCLIP